METAEAMALLERAFQSALAAADPAAILPQFLPPAPAGRLKVLGAGKAAAAMAAAVEHHYGDHYGGEVELSGLVIAPDGHVRGGRAQQSQAGTVDQPERIELALARHPLPDARGLSATARILAAARECGEGDHVIILISGGGSALLCAPAGIDLEQKASLTRELLRSGADITEINTVRKHLSDVKGGLLGLAAGPAPTTALVLSDVVGDDLAAIASGPTVPDPTTFQDAIAVLDRYSIPATAARASLEAGLRGARRETPKPGTAALDHVRTSLVGSNGRSLEAAARVVQEAGYRPYILSSEMTGEAREVGGVHAALVRQILASGGPFEPPCALISGGETTVTVRGSGRGGRNSEFCLALALGLPVAAPVAALVADTDGIDGSEDNAGAFISPDLLRRFDRRRARAFLEGNDSYTFFESEDHLLVTGPTGTNVNDLRIVLVGDAGSGAGSR